MAVKRLEAESLSHRCDPEQFQFTTTDDLDDLTGIIGQPRAVAAMRFGMGIRHKGYNLFALGPTGTGKHELVLRYAHEQAATEPLPPDWCYVNNFRDPHKPCKLRLPPARGARLKHDMNQLIEDLHATIPTIFESDEYHNRAREIEEEFSERKESAMQAVQDEAEKRHIALIQTPSGFTLAPVRGDSTLSQDEFEKLPEQERKHIIEDTDVLHEQLRKMLQETPRWHKAMRDQMSNLNREMASSAIKHLIDTLRSEYTGLADVIVFLGEVEKDVIENFRHFLREETEKPGFSLFGMDIGQHSDGEQADNRYRVNDFVTHEINSGAPVVYEDNPGYNNLLGRVEHRAELGALVTDFTMIRPGALHRANGGYLILDAIKLLTQPYAWEGLKRALQSNEIRIESLAQLMSLVSTVSLEPESIPLDVKVILLGEPHLYYLLSMYDPEFSELFKVAVDFDYRMDRTPESQQLYARFIATLIRPGIPAAFRPFCGGARHRTQWPVAGRWQKTAHPHAQPYRPAARGGLLGQATGACNGRGRRCAAGHRRWHKPARSHPRACYRGNAARHAVHCYRRRENRPGERPVGHRPGQVHVRPANAHHSPGAHRRQGSRGHRA